MKTLLCIVRFNIIRCSNYWYIRAIYDTHNKQNTVKFLKFRSYHLYFSRVKTGTTIGLRCITTAAKTLELVEMQKLR